MKQNVTWIGLVISLAFAAASADAAKARHSGRGAETAEQARAHLMASEPYAVPNDRGEPTRIRGFLTNRSRHTFRYVEMQFNLYDDHDHLIGNAIDFVRNLGPGDRWAYEAVGPDCATWKPARCVTR